MWTLTDPILAPQNVEVIEANMLKIVTTRPHLFFYSEHINETSLSLLGWGAGSIGRIPPESAPVCDDRFSTTVIEEHEVTDIIFILPARKAIAH